MADWTGQLIIAQCQAAEIERKIARQQQAVEQLRLQGASTGQPARLLAVMQRALREYVEHYHAERNHQGKDNVMLFPRGTDAHPERPVQCRERLGGLLRYYHQEAARPHAQLRPVQSRTLDSAAAIRRSRKPRNTFVIRC